MKRKNKWSPSGSIVSKIAIASNIIWKNSLKIPNNYVITTPTIWNYITKGNMAANESHPYQAELNNMRISWGVDDSPDQYLKTWNEELKNAFYGMVLLNPFHIPYDIPETYLYIFREAIDLNRSACEKNRFGINKEDLMTLNDKYAKMYGIKEDYVKAHDVWHVLDHLLNQNLL